MMSLLNLLCLVISVQCINRTAAEETSSGAVYNHNMLTTYHCCKIGEKLAKRGLSCSPFHYSKTWTSLENLQDGDQQKIISKAKNCVQDYSLNLKKCCQLFKEFLQEMMACKLILDTNHRRLCRNGVRQRYPY